MTLREQMRALEKEIVERVLKENNGNKTHTAVALGISRRGLYEILDRHGITEWAKTARTDK